MTYENLDCIKRAKEQGQFQFVELARKMDAGEKNLSIPSERLRAAGLCDKVNCVECQGHVHDPADVLLNPLPQKDRFGLTLKNGVLWMGVLAASAKGEIFPAAIGSGKRFVFGKENLESAGLNYGDEIIMPKTVAEWNRELLHSYLTSTETAPTAAELFRELRSLNESVVWHQDPRTHDFFAVFEMATAVYPIFPQFPKVSATGTPEAGKSTQTKLVARVCPNAIMSADASPASLKRDVETTAGLVADDNHDNLSEEQKLAFTQLYDTSFEDSGGSRRCGEEKRNKTETCRTYSPGIVNSESAEWMRRSSISRTIFVPHVTAAEDEAKKLTKLKDVPQAEFDLLHHKVRTWALENVQQVAELSKTIKPSNFNRDADLALPLLTVAKLVGDNCYKTIEEFLKDNFANYHAEDPFSENTALLSAIWAEFRAAPKETELAISVRTIAQQTLESRGVVEIEPNGQSSRGYAGKLQEECRKVSGLLKAQIPYRKTSRPGNKLHYYIERVAFGRFLRARGVVVEGVQDGL